MKRHVPSERPPGSAEPLPVSDPRGGDGVARGGRRTGAPVLAAADGRGPAGPGNGRHAQVHPERGVEMVTFDAILLHNDVL